MRTTMENAKISKSFVAAFCAAVGVVFFAALFLLGTRSFRNAITEIAEAETRVTIVNRDGSVFYDTEAAHESHASRQEIQQAFETGHAVSVRHSETVGKDLLYCARRVSDHVVRLAVPYNGVLRSERIAWCGLVAALLFGVCVVVLVFVLTRRLTKRLDAQSRQLEIATANETFRREFTSNVAHELKSPITAILGSVEMLGDGTTLTDAERQELFGIVKSESARLGSLVKDVLSLAQIEREQETDSAEFVRVPFANVVEAVRLREDAKARAAHVSLEVVRNDPADVVGDATRLEEVLVNLIENAIRYSGSDRVLVSSVADGSHVTVKVTDFGIGIPERHLPHLFERFYRVNKSRSRSLGGTGLGLAIVKHIVRLHGGVVSVESDPGRKTTFTCVLPQALPQ